MENDRIRRVSMDKFYEIDNHALASTTMNENFNVDISDIIEAVQHKSVCYLIPRER